MRSTPYQNARHRVGPIPARLNPPPGQLEPPRVDWVAAAQDALDGIRDVIARLPFDHPDTLTPHGITAYALALMHLRECASAAGFERLSDACDALAVTVSRLIENPACASPGQCAALTCFVAHAQAMIQMSAGQPASNRVSFPRSLPAPT